MKKRIRINLRFLSSFILAFCLCTALSSAAQNAVTGVVRDVNQEPLPGVAIIVKGSNQGTITNIDGQFSIKAKLKDVLVFSFVGMKSKEVKVTSFNPISLVLDEDLAALDEIVVVGYGTQKRGSITGAVSTVSDKDLLKSPTMSMSNVVGARVAGIAAVQSSGQPGSDNAKIKMRGQDGIVYVIDGIRRTEADFNGIDPNEIESISVLKDASAIAVYGLDANGVFIVTTKRGSLSKTAISYTGSVGWSKNAQKQEWLDGPSYAHWYNKARELQGDNKVFTPEMVKQMKAGTGGWGNTNWADMIYGTGFRTHHNVSASGGNERVKFFASLGYLNEEGNIKNFNYNRYNLRSNLDAKITNNLTFSLGISGRIEDRKAPRYSADPKDWHNVPQQIIRALPYVPSTMMHDGKIYNVSTPTSSSPVAPLASIEESGYAKSNNSYVQTNVSLQYDAPFLKGLTFKFQGAYDATFSFNKTLSNPYKVMIMNLPNAATTDLTYSLGDDSQGNTTSLMEQASRSYNITTQSSVSYSNRFGDHTVGALVLAETRENKSNLLSATGYGLDFISLDELNNIINQTGNGVEKHPEIGGYSGHTRVAGFVGRLNYNYADKYFAEAAMRYDGSYLFGGMNSRWVALPGASIGWRIDQEEWFKADWVNNLKLRGGIGKTANSEIKAFQWRNTMEIVNNSVMLGGGSQSMMYAAILGNPNLSWSQCLTYNIGVDATMFNGLLGAELDVFYKYEYDKLAVVTGAYPPSMGGYYFTTANSNKCDYKGFDFTLTHNNKVGNFAYGAKVIWSFAYGRWLKYAGDSDNAPDHQRLTGKEIGTKYGFIAEGLFQTEQEIAHSATITGSKAIPGYIKYRDINGDGVISAAQDQGYFGKSSVPKHTGSVDLFGNWKGFDFDLLFSWGLGGNVALTGIYTSTGSVGVQDNTAFTKPFYHGGNSPVTLVENCWTPDNPGAAFPRLEIDPVSNNNNFSSTLWYRNGNYLRLKTAQIGYTIPQSLIKRSGIQSLRVYAEGYNLLTFSGLTKYNIDPESPAVNNGYYPQQMSFSVGLKISF